MSNVFVVDTNKQPLDPVHPARARKLLSRGNAAVLKRYPFTIILKVECGSGGLTKYNRSTRKLPKTHWLDAVCVGKSTPEHITRTGVMPLSITAYGHGSRQMCLMDRYGFPCSSPKEKHPKHGFRTGDIVKAVVPAHLRRAGTHVGRMSAKASGSFTIATEKGPVTDVGKKHCQKLQRADGYGYTQRSA